MQIVDGKWNGNAHTFDLGNEQMHEEVTTLPLINEQIKPTFRR
jgi:hypothetical protein